MFVVCQIENMDNATVYEVDDGNRDEVLTGFMIGGPIYLTALIFVLILVIYQKLDLNQIRQNEERLRSQVETLENPVWYATQGDVEVNDMDGESYSQMGSGNTTPPMYEVSVETLTSHPINSNYCQIQLHTFQVSTGGE